MIDEDAREEQALPAGDFAPWLAGLEGALRGERASDVPCGGCTACCTSSQFIHIEPDETETLSHIPAHLLFPAPRLPPGHVLLGYDEHGRCPMLVDDACSIYDQRPRTCRTYDCRVLPAAGVAFDDDDHKPLIARQARRWRFSFPTKADRVQHDAVRAAATYLHEHPDVVPQGVVATNPTQVAVLAIESHGAFLRRDEETEHLTMVEPDPRAVRVELTLRTGLVPVHVGEPSPTRRST